MFRKYFYLVCCSLTICQRAFAANEFETVVTATRQLEPLSALFVPVSEENAPPSYPWMALAQSGVSASPSAGALSFGSIRYRGFSSSQLRILVDGYDFADVGTGLFNAYDLPLFGTDQFELSPGATDNALGGSLKLELKVPKDFSAKARGSFGSYGFGLVDMVVATGDVGNSKALMGLQLASSRGDYAISGVPRLNNDQSRMMGFFKSEHSLKDADLEFFVFGRQQEGGLAGPATFPTPHSRLLSQKLLFGTSLFWEVGSFPMKIKFQSRFDRNESSDETRTDNVAFLDNSLSFSVERKVELADTYSALESSIGQSQVLDGRFRRLSTRHGLSFDTAPFSFWSMRFKRAFGIEAHSDAGWFLYFATNISSKPLDPLTLGVRFGRNSRVPTLSEMYAPSGLILGNPELEPEKIHDGSLYAIYDVNDKLKLNLEIYYAQMTKAIFYVNRNSYLVEPINADHVRRGGIGFSMRYRPNDLFETNMRVDVLATQIEETKAPLPGATPFALSIDGRVGKEKGIFSRFSVIANAGSSSNLFGTLNTKPYSLVNASLHIPLHDHARVVFSATNLFDVTWAKTAYHYPMPGREFFVTLEASS
jgi:outer membrane cobalamin receptor